MFERGRDGCQNHLDNTSISSTYRITIEKKDSTSSETSQILIIIDKNSVKILQLKWVLDSGPTNHIISNHTQFQHISSVQTLIHIMNSTIIIAQGEGDELLILIVNRVKYSVTLKNVLYVPKMESCSLASLKYIQFAEAVVSFTKDAIRIRYRRKLYSITKLKLNKVG